MNITSCHSSHTEFSNFSYWPLDFNPLLPINHRIRFVTWRVYVADEKSSCLVKSLQVWMFYQIIDHISILKHAFEKSFHKHLSLSLNHFRNTPNKEIESEIETLNPQIRIRQSITWAWNQGHSYRCWLLQWSNWSMKNNTKEKSQTFLCFFMGTRVHTGAKEK